MTRDERQAQRLAEWYNARAKGFAGAFAGIVRRRGSSERVTLPYVEYEILKGDPMDQETILRLEKEAREKTHRERETVIIDELQRLQKKVKGARQLLEREEKEYADFLISLERGEA